MQIETVKIDAPEVEGGHIVINKCDFDAELHTLWSEESDDAPAGDDAPKRRGRPAKA